MPIFPAKDIIMDVESYLAAVDRAVTNNGPGGPDWNDRFEASIEREGLALKAANGAAPTKPHHVMAPQPYADGNVRWPDSWIVERDGTDRAAV